MAEAILSTRLSRRSMLAGGAVGLLPGVAAGAGGAPWAASGAAGGAAGGGRAEGESAARMAVLAARYRQASAALFDWMDATEARHGPLAYERRPEYRARTEALLALEAATCAALAQARPAGLTGLVLKLRAAFECDHLRDATVESDSAILLPGLRDLEWLAGVRRGGSCIRLVLPPLLCHPRA